MNGRNWDHIVSFQKSGDNQIPQFFLPPFSLYPNCGNESIDLYALPISLDVAYICLDFLKFSTILLVNSNSTGDC